MRRIIKSIILFILPYIYLLPAQAQWPCFTNGNQINCLTGQGKYLWAETHGGVVSMG